MQRRHHPSFALAVVSACLTASVARGFQIRSRTWIWWSGNRSQAGSDVPASTASSLPVKVERYTVDEGDGDEGLFAALMNERIARERAEGYVVRCNDNDAEGAAFTLEKSAREPSASLGPEAIVPLIMGALENNDAPSKDAGLEVVWAFATDTTKFVFKNNITEFIESCHQSADEFPTSFYGAAMEGRSWALEAPINRVGGADGWIATQVMRTISSDGRLRRWQWELRKSRRPPDLGCWRVESIGSSDRNGNFEAREGDGWSD